MSDLVKEILGNSEKVLNRALDNKNINITIKILLGLYAALAAPKLPPTLANLVDNTFIRIAFAFVIVYMATRDPSIAILVAIAFIVTLQTANKMRLYNTNLSVSQPGQTSWLPSAKNIYVQSEDSLDEQEDSNNLFDNVVNAGSDFVTDVVDTGADLTENVYDASVNLVDNVINTGKDFVTDVVDTGYDLSENVYNTGANLVDNVVDTGSDFVENTIDTGSDFLQGVVDSGNNLFTNVSDIGSSLLNINDNRTASVSNPSEQLNEIVEGWQGVYSSSAKNASAVNNHDNTVPGSNQYSCTRTFNNQHCIQGLEVNAPNGGEYSNFTEF